MKTKITKKTFKRSIRKRAAQLRRSRYAPVAVIMAVFVLAGIGLVSQRYSGALGNQQTTDLATTATHTLATDSEEDGETAAKSKSSPDKPKTTAPPPAPAPSPPAPAPAPPPPAPPACPNQQPTSRPAVDMWVWQPAAATDAGQRTALLSFAGSNRVQTIYLESEKLINTDQGSLANFTKEAKQQCIAVALLFGAPDWAFTRNHSYVVSLAQKSVTFAKQAAVSPVGIQFDVEPYNLDEYKADVNAGANQYLDMLEKIQAVTNPTSLYFAKAMPLGFEFQSVTRNGQTLKLSHATIDRVDRVVLMDYRDTASRIIDDASDEMQHAANKGKKVTIGVETSCTTGEVETITFCEEGKAYMDGELLKVQNHYGGRAAFAGLAVHDYAAYKSL